jgi:hypothetical protein
VLPCNYAANRFRHGHPVAALDQLQTPADKVMIVTVSGMILTWIQ